MGKKWKAAAALVEPKMYGLKESVELVKRTAYAKFDETVEMALRLGVEPKRSDQMVRGSVVLPHGTGIKVRRNGRRERQGQRPSAVTSWSKKSKAAGWNSTLPSPLLT